MESIVLEQAMDALHILRSTTIRRRDYYTRNIRKLHKRRRTRRVDESIELNHVLMKRTYDALDRLSELEGGLASYKKVTAEQNRVFFELKKLTKHSNRNVRELTKLRKTVEALNSTADRVKEKKLFKTTTTLMEKVKRVKENHAVLYSKQKDIYRHLIEIFDEILQSNSPKN